MEVELVQVGLLQRFLAKKETKIMNINIAMNDKL
jgi:hypothetical protein